MCTVCKEFCWVLQAHVLGLAKNSGFPRHGQSQSFEFVFWLEPQARTEWCTSNVCECTWLSVFEVPIRIVKGCDSEPPTSQNCLWCLDHRSNIVADCPHKRMIQNVNGSPHSLDLYEWSDFQLFEQTLLVARILCFSIRCCAHSQSPLQIFFRYSSCWHEIPPSSTKRLGQVGIVHDDFSHAHVERTYSLRNLQRLTLSLSLCLCVCVRVRACVYGVYQKAATSFNNWELPWATMKEPSEAMRFGYAVRQAEIRHQALLEQSFLVGLWTWQSRTRFLCFSACFSLLFAPRATPLIRLDLNAHDLPKLCARQMVLSALLFPCLWNLRCVARCGTSRFSCVFVLFDALESQCLDPN